MTDSAPIVARPTGQEAWKRLAITAGTVAGTVVAVRHAARSPRQRYG
jgi:hypothetical protein